MQDINKTHLEHITSKRYGIYNKYIKRILDIVFSFISLIILGPLLLIIAGLIKIKLGGPVLFKQERPGLDEQIFTIYKFRTMTNETDDTGELLPDSIRLTKFGRILRSTSLDELPELLNILKGDMSFVGPRPLSVKYIPYYTEYERHRHTVKPGLTGLAQINGRNKTTWDQRFVYDVNYVSNMSFMFDIIIILKTFLVVLKREDIVVRGTGIVEDFHEYRKKQNKARDNT